MPIGRWIDKEDVVYIHNGILFNYKKKEIMPSQQNDGPKFTIPSEISQRKRNIIWYHLYVESKKTDTNELK